jgi:tRNA1Val (adenine37-N6)-methyltransferase
VFAAEELSDDAFLGGLLRLWQPRQGYRASTDPVLLAACCGARAGETVLDLGCGIGTAALCLGWRVPGVILSGVEIQPAYADLAARNAARAGLSMQVATGDVLNIPHALRLNYDHVITNPPYYRPSGTPADDPGRDRATREEVSLADWISAANRRVRPGGWLTLILRADRLDDALRALGGSMGSIRILPLSARPGRDAGRVVLRARKTGRAALRLLAPLILHSGDQHPGDRDNHSPEAGAVFRSGKGLCHLFD